MSREEAAKKGEGHSRRREPLKQRPGSMNQLSTFAKCEQFSMTKAESLN